MIENIGGEITAKLDYLDSRGFRKQNRETCWIPRRRIPPFLDEVSTIFEPLSRNRIFRNW